MDSKLTFQEIHNDIYWVGINDKERGLHCNPYLIVDGEEAVLIDPGSVIDFEYVVANVKAIVPLEKIKYIVLGHQDADFCSAIPLLEQIGLKATIATHWRTSTLIQFYGIKSPYYHVNEHGFKLKLDSGRTLIFVPTPYMHFPGAIATYDTKSKILFSSDVFGAFSYNWSLYADQDYLEKMLVFHEHYMPSNDIIRPVMEKLLLMNISMIAPQHGSIIKDDIKKYIIALRELECGTFLNPIKKEVAKTGGYTSVCNQVIKRYCSIFSVSEFLSLFTEADITINKDTLILEDFNYTGEKLWNKIFETIYLKKGISWISVVEPFVRKLVKEYDLPTPSIFKSEFINIEKENETFANENEKLKELNKRLEKNVLETQDKLIKCPLTGLYNELFCSNYCKTEFEEYINKSENANFALMLISIDNLSKINFNYGNSIGNETLKNFAYLLNSLKEEQYTLFRMHSSTFSIYLPNISKSESIAFAEKIRVATEKSELFIETITVSVGMVNFEELESKNSSIEQLYSQLTNLAEMRLVIAKNRGFNNVCSESEMAYYNENIGKILIIDTDVFTIDTLRIAFENQKYTVFTTTDSETALELIEKEKPDAIISEIFLPKMDGFNILEKISQNSYTQNIPFILMSHLKTEDSIKRAFSMNIDYYFQKPFILSEMLSVVNNKIKGENRNGYRN